MRAFICWTHISGYMAACWRAMAARGDVDVAILAFQSNVPQASIAFADDIVRGLNVRLLTPQEQQDERLIASLVAEHNPDVVVLPGWSYRAFRRLVDEPILSRAKFIMTMDTPWRGTLRQKLGRYKIASYLSRIDCAIVAGERAWQFARALGLPEEKIRRGLYGVDDAALSQVFERRLRAWPRRFLFAGRYEPVKGIDILISAYRAYRASVSDPWELTCCGTGPLASLLDGEAGVRNLGFVQPAQQVEVYADHGVFVLPSRYDPWPLVIVESCAAGLPVIHTEACGSAVELVRPWYNGIGVATENVNALASAMRWCHENHDNLPEMGIRGQQLAAAYSAEVWAQRWVKMFEELVG